MIKIIEAPPNKLSGITSLHISFDFNAEIIPILKSCDKYIYDKKTHIWEFPITCLSYLLDNLTYLDDITLKLYQQEVQDAPLTATLSHEYPPFEHQLEAINYGLSHSAWLLLDAPGMGKAFTLDTNIVTPSGYKPIADIHVGDTVFDEQGNACSVLAEYNHESLNMYKITFTTGESITCCEDHLWPVIYNKGVWDADSKAYNPTEFREIRDVKWLVANDHYRKYCMRTLFCDPIKFTERKHIIHPYVLGCLLGDGSLTQGGACITTCDDFIYDKIKQLLPETVKLSNYAGSINYGIVKKKNTGRENIYIKELKRLGLYKHNSYDKFIPTEYLYDSIDNRLCLLQGLMDTDGTVAKKIKNRDSVSNATHFGTSSKQLANDFEFLIRSLGGYTHIRKFKPRYYNKKYEELRESSHSHFSISVHMNNMPDVFSLPRKLERVAERKFRIRRKFKSIEYVGKAPGKCITVDSPNHLYLADKCLVTHNTVQMIYLAEELKAQCGLEHCLIICGINTLKTNWKREIEKYSTLSCRILGEKISKKGKISYSSIKERAAELMNPIDEFFVICNIETLRSADVIQALKTTKNKIGMIVLDEAHKCLVGGTLIETDQGNKTIQEIVDNKLECKIKSFNTLNNTIEYKDIDSYYRSDEKEDLIELVIVDEESIEHKLVCTQDHPIFTSNRGYVEAKHLLDTDIILID